MLRRIEPSVIICCHTPFPEMQGNIVHVDYELSSWKHDQDDLDKAAAEPSESIRIVKHTGYVIFDDFSTRKGGGSAAVGGALEKFPGWDPTKPPGPDYEWRGSGEPGLGQGNWYNPKTGESLRADFDHPPPIAPHWDYNYRGSGERGWRIFEDGSRELKLYEWSETDVRK